MSYYIVHLTWDCGTSARLEMLEKQMDHFVNFVNADRWVTRAVYQGYDRHNLRFRVQVGDRLDSMTVEKVENK